MYGLPKIHKPNIPLRPIVSSIGSATYHLAKELSRIVSPLLGKTNSYVKDSGDFVHKIKDIQVDENTILNRLFFIPFSYVLRTCHNVWTFHCFHNILRKFVNKACYDSSLS